MYGLTETTGVVTQLDFEDHDSGGPRAKLLRSAGKPFPGATLRIVDEQPNTLLDGEVGEFWVHSPQNLKACSTDPEATARAFPLGPDENGMGWSATGDAGYLKDGYLFIHDRIKDMIASGAKNIYPAEIDNVLMSHPGVADAIASDRKHQNARQLHQATIIVTDIIPVARVKGKSKQNK